MVRDFSELANTCLRMRKATAFFMFFKVAAYSFLTTRTGFQNKAAGFVTLFPALNNSSA